MSELISGKEALIALANGEEIEYKALDKNFYPLIDFLDSAKLRLKPRTIEINGVELKEPSHIQKVGPSVLSLEFSSESECNVFLKTLQNRNF